MRGVPGLQAGPRPQCLSVTGASAEPSAAACAPGAEPPALRAPRSGPTFPSPPDAEGTARRHKVAGANGARAAASLSPTEATFSGAESLLGPEVWGNAMKTCEVGPGQRLVPKRAAAAPRDSCRAGAQSGSARRNLGCVLVEAAYGFGSGIGHTHGFGRTKLGGFKVVITPVRRSWLKSVRAPRFKSLTLVIGLSGCLDVTRTGIRGEVFLLCLRIYKTIKFIMLSPSWPRGIYLR